MGMLVSREAYFVIEDRIQKNRRRTRNKPRTGTRKYTDWNTDGHGRKVGGSLKLSGSTELAEVLGMARSEDIRKTHDFESEYFWTLGW